MSTNVAYTDASVKTILLDTEEYINMKDESDKPIPVNLFN